MIVGSAFFVGLAALVKRASDEASAMQAVLYRSVFSAVPILAVMAARRIPVPSRTRPRLLLLRGLAGFLALFFYLWAVSHIHLADTLALQQLSPIFVAFLSVVLLRERPRRSHYALAAVCLTGALLVVRPSRGLASLDSAAALVSALFSSAAYVTVRALTRTEPTERIVVWFSFVAAALSLPFVVADWRPLSLRSHLLLIGAGLMAAAAQTMMTASYRRAPAHIASAFSYASVPLAYLVGLLFWHEKPDALANIGIALIVAGGVTLVATSRKSPSASR
jgi:drug/metabolite transporter (DMT)-like permease